MCIITSIESAHTHHNVGRRALGEVYVCLMVFIFKLYRNKQRGAGGGWVTLHGENNVSGGEGNLTFPVFTFPI